MPKRSPADDPGAIVIYPKVDPMMVYDPANGIVIDQRNGDIFNSQLGDREDQFFYFFITNKKTRHFTEFSGRRLSVEKPGYGNTTGYEITVARRGSDHSLDGVLLHEDMTLDRLAAFLNAYRKIADGEAGNVVIIDNREKLRSKVRIKQ